MAQWSFTFGHFLIKTLLSNPVSQLWHMVVVIKSVCSCGNNIYEYFIYEYFHLNDVMYFYLPSVNKMFQYHHPEVILCCMYIVELYFRA